LFGVSVGSATTSERMICRVDGRSSLFFSGRFCSTTCCPIRYFEKSITTP
jgi:hypothetical protein